MNKLILLAALVFSCIMNGLLAHSNATLQRSLLRAETALQDLMDADEKLKQSHKGLEDATTELMEQATRLQDSSSRLQKADDDLRKVNAQLQRACSNRSQ